MTSVYSIIIPVYNVAPYLRACLDSVLRQTNPDWEAICVDDGSTDGCAAILDEYAAKDGRFRVFHQTNQGVSAARQRGLDAVRGTYFGFVDPDDWVDPEMFGEMVAALETSRGDYLWEEFAEAGAGGTDGTTGTDGTLGTDGTPMRRSGGLPVGRPLSLAADLIEGRTLASLCVRLFRTDFVRQNAIRFLPGRIKVCEDLAFIVSILAHQPSCVYLDAAHYHYRRVASSITHSLDRETVRSWRTAGDFLLALSRGTEMEGAVLNFRSEIKCQCNLLEFLSDDEFAQLFPEVRSRGESVFQFRRFLFSLSLRGHRRAVVRLAKTVRFLKRMVGKSTGGVER